MKPFYAYRHLFIIPALLLINYGCEKAVNVPSNPTFGSQSTPTATFTASPTSTASPTPTAIPDDICYASPVGSTMMTLYRVHPDGTGLTAVTPNSIKAFHPSWSPDKSQIAFGGYGTNPSQIYTIHSDGTGLTQLTTMGGSTPAWSPDGTRIAFVSNAGQAWVMNSNGTNLRQITSDPNFVISSEDMAWSPDSARLVYSSDIASATRICDADGSNVQNFPVHMVYIDWSPDGTKFVYGAYTGTTPAGVNVWQVFVVNADGTGLTQLTNTPDSHGGPSWSRDGSKIIFVDSSTTAATNMYTMNPDGSGVVPLPNAYIYYCYQPCWH